MGTILISGASTGIGLETALAFTRAGHKVVGAMRRPDRAPELAKVAARESLDVVVITMDVDDDASVAHAVARVAREIGPIDVLVNNAGIERMGSVEEWVGLGALDDDAWYARIKADFGLDARPKA